MNINNNKLYTGRYHGLLIAKSLKKEQLTPICNKKPDIGINYYKGKCKLKELPKEYFDKFYSILWDFHSSPLSNKMKFFIIVKLYVRCFCIIKYIFFCIIIMRYFHRNRNNISVIIIQ